MFLTVFIGLVVAVIIAAWKVFEKAGEPGWAAIIPIYNYFVILRIVGRPGWWFFLSFVPLVNIIIGFIVTNDLSKSFGKGIGFTLGLIFLGPIFWLILGFGEATYEGAAAASPSEVDASCVAERLRSLGDNLKAAVLSPDGRIDYAQLRGHGVLDE